MREFLVLPPGHQPIFNGSLIEPNSLSREQLPLPEAGMHVFALRLYCSLGRLLPALLLGIRFFRLPRQLLSLLV
jgi:hypothetical protein